MLRASRRQVSVRALPFVPELRRVRHCGFRPLDALLALIGLAAEAYLALRYPVLVVALVSGRPWAPCSRLRWSCSRGRAAQVLAANQVTPRSAGRVRLLSAFWTARSPTATPPAARSQDADGGVPLILALRLAFAAAFARVSTSNRGQSIANASDAFE
jgi:hypothetical protein